MFLKNKTSELKKVSVHQYEAFHLSNAYCMSNFFVDAQVFKCTASYDNSQPKDDKPSFSISSDTWSVLINYLLAQKIEPLSQKT